MTNEDEKLQSMNNGDLVMEFLKKCQKCRETGVPNDMAILAALHDLADWKDAHPSKDMVRVEDAYNWIEQHASDYVGRSEYMASDFREFMKHKNDEFVEHIVPVSTHDDNLSEEKVERYEKLEEFVKEFTQKCGLDSDIETLLPLARMEYSRMLLDFK